jgi:putative FmdB family regulatory protein
MPTYEYVCSKCDQHLEVYQSFSEEPLKPLKRHSGCGGKLTKVMGAVGIVLKGSGFYKTDSRSSAKSRSDSRSGDGSASESKAPAASDSTSDARSSTKSDASGAKSGAKADKASKPAKKSA